MTRHPGSPTVLLRTALTAPLLSLFLVLTIAALTLVTVLVPPLVDQARTATVHHQIDQIPEAGRSLTAGYSGIPGANQRGEPVSGIWSGPLRIAADARDRQPEPLRSVLGTPRIIGVFGATGLVADRAVPLNHVQVVMDPGLGSRSRLVRGAFPQPTDPAAGIQVALTERAAAALDWKIGERRNRQDLVFVLVGLVEPNGADEFDWDMLVGAREPVITYTSDGSIVQQTVAFMAPDEAGLLGELRAQASTVSWIPVHQQTIDAGNAAKIGAQLRLFLANPVHVGAVGSFYDRGLVYATPVADALDRGVARADTLVAVVAVAAVGPLTVAGVVLALAGRQLALRRGRATALARARGASIAQLIGALAGEALVLAVLGAALGIGIGAALTGGTPHPVAMPVLAALALTPVCAVPLSAVAELRRSERRDQGAERRRSWRRLLLECAIVAAALALGAILVGRGSGLVVDPVLLAIPVLVSAAGTVLVMRLLPLLLERLHRVAARRTGLVALLGPARALREAALRTAPALAAVIGLAVAVFSVSFAAAVSDGIARTARLTTGADVAVTAPFIDEAQIEAARAVPGVAALAALEADEIGEGASPVAQGRVRIYAVDRAAFTRAQRGFDGALPLPAELASTSGGPIPVVASEQLLAEFGDGLRVNGHEVRVVARTGQPTPFGSAEKWVIVDRANQSRIGVASPLVSRLFLAVAPGSDPGQVAKALAPRLDASATVTTVRQLIAAATSDPASAALNAALAAATAIAAGLLALAVVQTLLLGGAARARLLALLRAVGYPRRGELPLVGWEVGPALLVALPVGLAAGLAMSWLVVAGLDLRGFTGGGTALELGAGAGGIALVVLGFVLVTAAAVIVATAGAMRLRSADAVRVADGEE